jgi:membrane protease YdiL (CAAX protease family)
MSVNVKKVAVFVGLVYGLANLFATLYFARGGTMRPPGLFVLLLVYMYIPMVSTIIVQKLIYRAPLKQPLRINFRPNRWFLVAWLLPVLLALATLGVSLLLPGVTLSANKKDLFEDFILTPARLGIHAHQFGVGLCLALIQSLVTGITFLAILSFGEEVGWRGFLQRELSPLGFWKASALIGLIWGLWNAPLIFRGLNYPLHPWAGVFEMTAMTVLLSPLLGYLALKADSVVAATLFMGTFNGAAAVVAPYGVQGGSDLLIGVSGLAGLLVLLIANVGLALLDPETTGSSYRWRQRSARGVRSVSG